MKHFDGDDAHKILGAETIEAVKKKRIAEFRKEATRKMSMANKRLRRLEKNNLIDSPAYQGVLKTGKAQFSVKGKDYNELQREVARMDKFINAQTSTVRGVNTVLKDMAKNTGIKYKNLKELRVKSAKFFELASKVEQYLRTVADMASAIGYQKIWDAINKYTSDVTKNMDLSKMDIDDAVDSIVKSLDVYEEEHKVYDNYDGSHVGWYSLKDDD